MWQNQAKKKQQRIYEIKNMIEKNLHVNICECVRMFRRRNSFRTTKKCHQMEYKHIFTTQSVGHHFGHFCWRTMWRYNSIIIIQRTGTTATATAATTTTTVIRISCNILFGHPQNRSAHLWNFRPFWMRKDFTEMVFTSASNEKDPKIDFTTLNI